MTVTASIFFMGEYRPVYFESETVRGAAAKLEGAIAGLPAIERAWFAERILEAKRQCLKENCAAYASEHGCRGLSIAKRPHDSFLDTVIRKLPVYPSLDYSESVAE